MADIEAKHVKKQVRKFYREVKTQKKSRSGRIIHLRDEGGNMMGEKTKTIRTMKSIF